MIITFKISLEGNFSGFLILISDRCYSKVDLLKILLKALQGSRNRWFGSYLQGSQIRVCSMHSYHTLGWRSTHEENIKINVEIKTNIQVMVLQDKFGELQEEWKTKSHISVPRAMVTRSELEITNGQVPVTLSGQTWFCSDTTRFWPVICGH